ncbi:unnamed protein product [Larinioides sclopetarius]|uniref:Uncharacterized protein n=1 Tax=Larinioides sclopetarius TaxID=280406 RepID=A0AAV2BY07_9ARAC
MKLLLIILCTVTCHYCVGYPNVEDEISEDVLTGNETSVEYLIDTTNDTSSNDSLTQHGFFKKVGGGIKGGIKSINNKINNLKNKIGTFKDNSGSGRGIGGGRYIGGIRTNSGSGSGSGGYNPEIMKWIFIGIGVVLVVALVGLSLYYYQTRRNRKNTVRKFQQVNKM